jgi:hypothetical protein
MTWMAQINKQGMAGRCTPIQKCKHAKSEKGLSHLVCGLSGSLSVAREHGITLLLASFESITDILHLILWSSGFAVLR